VDNEAEIHTALQELSEALGNPALETDVSLGVAVIREATRRLLKESLVPWPRVRTLSTLPNTKLTPVVVLARTLEKAQHGKLKSVYIGLHWADRDEFDYDYSLMPVRDLSMHRLVIDRRLQNVAFGGSDTNETLTPVS
jgi:hypothetical protein